MTRTIKFRGKRMDDTEYNGKWVYGYYVFYPEDNKAIIETYACKDIVDPETIGQFIGLRDINDKEIYEDDICKVIDPMGDEDTLCIVEWNPFAVAYTYEPEDGYGDYDSSTIGWAMDLGFRFEVIGNIYDNPEWTGGGNKDEIRRS